MMQTRREQRRGNFQKRFSGKCFLAAVFCCLVLPGALQAEESLAVKWLDLDGLTAKTDEETLVIDTQVMEADAIKRKAELAKDPEAQAWTKSEITDPWSCVGSISGVRIRSNSLSVKGRDIILGFYMYGPSGPFVYVEGFRGKKKIGRETLRCTGKAGRWTPNEKLLHFEEAVDSVRVEIFCLKPLGIYRFNRFKLQAAVAVPEGNAGKELLPNGDFEAGGEIPDNWAVIDNLTTFWEKDSRGNHYIRIDTDVYKTDFEKRREELINDPAAAPRPKVPTKGKKYNTVGGTIGVSLRSRKITVKPRTTYLLKVRFKGPDAGLEFVPKVFVKGYGLVNGQYRKLYQAYKQCRATKDKWAVYSRDITPAGRMDKVEYVIIQLYAYWPAGEYYFDDVSFTEIGPWDGKTTEERKQKSEVRNQKEEIGDPKGRRSPEGGTGDRPEQRKKSDG